MPRKQAPSLRKLPLEDTYRSDRLSIARHFYVPCLGRAVRYSRAAGYFTSSSLSVAAAGLEAFIDGGGTMRLVASPHLTEDDVEAITRGYADRQDVIAGALARGLGSDPPDPVKERLAFLAWLVAHQRLDVKIALVESGNALGIYHEKFGIFEDANGDFVAFSGSANESAGGLVNNFETLDVFRSWDPADARRADEKRRQFDELWHAETKGLAVYAFPDAARDRLIEFQPPGGRRPQPAPEPPDQIPEVATVASTGHGQPSLPPGLTLRDYQRKAVDAWLANKGQGIWEMATGTGKTITALTGLTELADRARTRDTPILAVIMCPLQHLVTQWADEARKFGVEPVVCFESAARWGPRLGDALAALRAGTRKFGLVITTNTTLATSRFNDAIVSWSGALVFIADEVHNAGATSTLGALPPNANYRLGLSATPHRWLDDTGTASIIEYFGDTVFEYGLDQAVRDGVLSPYRYHPLEITLEADETELYLELTRKIGALIGRSSGAVDDTDAASGGLQTLLFARARLVGGARNKLEKLRAVMGPLRDSTHNLVYCSDATSLGQDDADGEKQVLAAVHMLGVDLKMRVASYTHHNSPTERQELRDQFESGALQALVAIRCLDEGVDIPATRRAFILASSTNPRQFIQRRGRVLRRAPGKDRADIFDFITVPPAGALTPTDFETERRLVARELQRVVEFALTAENGPQAFAALLPLRQRYHLLDLGPEEQE